MQSNSNHTEQFLRALRDAGPVGVPNYKLSDIALQYNFHIHILRKRGYKIGKRRGSRTDGKASQTWYYFLEGSAPIASIPSAQVVPPKEEIKTDEQEKLFDIPEKKTPPNYGF